MPISISEIIVKYKIRLTNRFSLFEKFDFLNLIENRINMMTIRFKNNNVYRFENVDLNDYKRFSTDTISSGKAFYREINSRYKGTRL
jgi:hypothetical protein